MIKGLQAEWGICSCIVSPNYVPLALTCWKDIVALGLQGGDIIILDVFPGICKSVHSKHTSNVNSLAFSSDGVFFVSGSNDKTVKLWDTQTGGVVKTFCGHTHWVLSVAISLHCTMIASGSVDETIHLWDTQIGECHCVVDGHNHNINSISFSPTNPQHLMSASHDGTIQQWDIDGCKIGPSYGGYHAAFSSDGTHFVSWHNTVATVQNSSSGTVITELEAPKDWFQYCCLSPNSELLAGGVGSIIYVWDITSSDPCLIKTFIGHTNSITSLIFSSSLISSSFDQSIRFWQIDVSSTDPVIPDPEPILLHPIAVKSIRLQTNNGIAISSNSTGVVRVWDILTGLCRTSFNTPAEYIYVGDAQLIDGRLIFVWYSNQQIHIWDSGEGILKIVPWTIYNAHADLRILGDGSKVFVLDGHYIQALYIHTGEDAGSEV